MKSLRRQRSRVGVISHNGGYLGDSIPVASGDYNPSERRHQSEAGKEAILYGLGDGRFEEEKCDLGLSALPRLEGIAGSMRHHAAVRSLRSGSPMSTISNTPITMALALCKDTESPPRVIKSTVAAAGG